ncbi:MAG: ABC transporter permease [candidate division Zixibacteria bacterium]|nr:ABC transporter permease [candidate division Zixibacteria bacterium]
MLTMTIAWRNIFRQKRRTTLTILTLLGGFTLSAISIGWSDGTYNRIIEMFTRNRLGHIQIHAAGYLDRPSLYRNITNGAELGSRIEDIPEVEAWTPRLFSAALASVAEKTSGVQIVGINPEREARATRFDRKIIDGRSLSAEAAHETVIGRGLARTLKAGCGDEIVVVSQGADGSIANDLYTIVGILESGDAIQDQASLYLHLADAQELLVLAGAVHELVVIASSLEDVAQATEAIQSRLNEPNLEVAPWQEFARPFYVAMKADQQGSWIGLFIIVLIVSIGVLNTILMTVLERTREYGVLKAVGTRPGQVFRLVLYEVWIMSIVGVTIGAGISLIINYTLSIHGIVMPQAFTYGGMEFTHYYAEVNARSILIPAVTVILSAVLVSILPALRAARVAPARALRTH